MKSSVKTMHSVLSMDFQFYTSSAETELKEIKADILLLNQKLCELYTTIRLLFEHHPNDREIFSESVDTNRFHRVTRETGFDQLITEMENQLETLKSREVALKSFTE